MARLPNYDPAEHCCCPETDLTMTRREILRRTGMGMGALSLSMILASTLTTENARGAELVAVPTPPVTASTNPLAPKLPPLPAKAKHVIHIFAGGGPSHVDTFDPKPALIKYADQSIPNARGIAFPSPFKFNKCGKSGLEISELFPHLGDHCADDLCVVRSMWTDIPAHEPASRFIHTGATQIPKPSLGSWVLYGLGTDNQNMPGFITMGGRAEYRQASFLPSLYEGSNVDYTVGMPLNQILLNIHSPFTDRDDQRRQLDLARKLNQMYSDKIQKEEQLEARIESFEMAFRMQTEATDAFDVNKESKETRNLYGNSEFGAKLLVARRLVERGVRFVQVFAGGWDHHANLEPSIKRTSAAIDQPLAALLQDLKQRGLLDDTLVIWGGEFGRTVTRDNNGNANPGRDHNGKGFCTVLAGGGVKGGTAYGSTDEFGAAAVENKCHVHDLHATILRLLGFDHTKLTYRYNGRDFRLTDNYGNVCQDIIA